MARFALPGLKRLAAITGLLLAVACAVTPVPPPAAPPPAPAPATPALVPASTGPSVTIPLEPPPPPSDFERFIARMHAQARAAGISEDTFKAATAGIAPLPAIAGMNDNQPEFSRPVWAYLDSAVSARRIKDGKAMLAEFRQTLAGIEKQSGVPREILLAIWGMESDFGRDAGSFNLFAALATLGYQGPRADYAAPEFLAALKIMQEQHYAAAEMKSSWAGAFGQTQFTPTTFLKYAADGDHDGRINLWTSPADALASAANLLASQGWKATETWGFEVKLPKRFAYEDADIDATRPVNEWRRRGVRTVSGGALPPYAGQASIYLPAGAKGPAFLLLPNFSVILKYNNAASYALAVAELGERIMDRPGIKASWPRKEHPLSRDERLRFQQALVAAGFDPGKTDGVLGHQTRLATRQYQKAHGLIADGYPTADLLAVMERR
ncbi:MAG: lytic murein transglycosylase [Alphaproteobacteria bacterium]|nr:lytic murein transglycosylase [Alphaproteobacteria bacterium]